MEQKMTDEEFEETYKIFLAEAANSGVIISPSDDGKGHLYVNGKEADIVEILEDFFK